MFEALSHAAISEQLTQLVYGLLQRVGRAVLGKAAVGWRG
jgi:hypothetical protein